MHDIFKFYQVVSGEKLFEFRVQGQFKIGLIRVLEPGPGKDPDCPDRGRLSISTASQDLHKSAEPSLN